MDRWLKEKPQLTPYIMAILTTLYQNFNIHCHYSNFLSALRSFVILNLHQYTLRTLLLMSGKAYLFLLSHTFKVILDTKKNNPERIKILHRQFLEAKGSFTCISITINIHIFQSFLNKSISFQFIELTQTTSDELISTLKMHFPLPQRRSSSDPIYVRLSKSLIINSSCVTP